MAKTIREQVVTYVAPALKVEMDRLVEVGKAQGKRVSLSSLGEEAMTEGLRIVRQRYATGHSFNPPTQGAPGKTSRRGRKAA